MNIYICIVSIQEFLKVKYIYMYALTYLLKKIYRSIIRVLFISLTIVRTPVGDKMKLIQKTHLCCHWA